MTLATSIWAASLGGALLFFAAGFLSAHRRRLALQSPVGLEVVPPPPESSEIDLTALRDRLARSDALVAEMRQERQRLVARLEAAEQLHPKREPVPLLRPERRSQTQGGTEEALESVISKIATTRGARAVALADELGLPIVGWGEDVNSLAAFAAYVDSIGAKATEMTSLSGVLRIDVCDRDRATVSLCPMAVDDARIVLVTMTAGPGPSTPQMQRVLEGAARMI